MYSYSIYEALGAPGIQALSLSGQHSDTEIYKVKQNPSNKKKTTSNLGIMRRRL